MSLSAQEMREIFERTVIVRTPTYGIVKGYHELPYVCIGEALKADAGSMRVKGRIHVSPQFVIRPRHYQSSYGDIFGEDDVDRAISGRIFGFLGFPNHPVECVSEHLELRHEERTVDDILGFCLDELERMEDITTGVFITPQSRYYQISVERFISSIVEQEFL